MLTAEHVDARRRGNELILRRLDARDLREAHELAEAYVDLANAHVGHAREQLYEAWQAIETGARNRRMAGGIRKLVEDECVFDEQSLLDPVVVRRAVFGWASRARRAPDSRHSFDRASILETIAADLAQPVSEIERSLFADLRGEHILKRGPILNASSIVHSYELGRAQAILLRAVRVQCEIVSGSPSITRSLFAWLKFQKLLFTAERKGDSGFSIAIDGPYSMFESVTKYGLRLALAMPAFRSLDSWSMVADVRWGKERVPLQFRLSSADGLADGRKDGDPLPGVSAEVTALRDGVNALADRRWSAETATTVLERPGFGICIPDLVLRRADLPAPVYVEVLGFWSRDAVWKRVELAQQGLGERIVFCASSRLRVSPEVMGKDTPAGLYVFKGKPNARSLIEHVDRLAAAMVDEAR